jgi:hypothetical protein
MKIEPIDEIFPLKIENPQIEETLRKFSILLQEVGIFGSIIVADIFKDDKGINEYVRSVISCLLRDIVEDIDAISVLINKSISNPCRLNLRRIFENYIYLKFILKEKSENRAKAYRVCALLNKIKEAEREDCSTNAWKQLKKEIEEDELLKNISMPTKDRKPAIAEIEKILQSPRYLGVMDEIEQLKKSKKIKNQFHWYSLFGGRNNLADLSASIGCSGIYNLYRFYSKFAHNETALENLDFTGPNEAGLIQIRNPEHAQDICQMALNFSLHALQIALDSLKPELMKIYTRFYIENIRPSVIELSKQKVINVIRNR